MIAVLAQEPRRAERETRDAIDTATTLLNTLVRHSKTPGLQYLAVSRGGVVFAHDAGAADLASARPVSSRTTMMAYSMSKTITAAAVLQLVGHRSSSRRAVAATSTLHSMMRVYPADGIGTVAMANATAIDVRGVLEAVDPRFLGARPNPS
jgi:hypothetical protein